jgi:hypothetical protein
LNLRPSAGLGKAPHALTKNKAARANAQLRVRANAKTALDS